MNTDPYQARLTTDTHKGGQPKEDFEKLNQERARIEREWSLRNKWSAFHAAMLPISVGASIATGNPLPAILYSSVEAANAADFIRRIYFPKKDPSQPSLPLPETDPFGAGSALFWDLMTLGNENNKGWLNKSLMWLIKRGEGDIPKEFNSVLKIYDAALQAVTLPPKLAFMAGGYVAAVAEFLMQKRSEEQRKSEEEAQKAAEEELQKLEAETRRTNELLEFSRNREFTNILSEDQEQLIDSLIEFNDPETENVVRNQNLYGWLNIDPRTATEAEVFSAAVEERKTINTALESIKNTFSQQLQSPTFLSNLYSYLQNPDLDIQGISDSEKESINTILRNLTDEGNLTPANYRNNLRIRRLVEDLKNLQREVFAGKSIDETFEIPSEIVKVAEKLVENPDNLEKYREAWLTGGAYSTLPFSENIGTTSALPESVKDSFREAGVGEYNPFMFLGFVTPPETADIENRIKQIDALKKAIPTPDQIKITLNKVENRYSEREIRQNLNVISSLSRNQAASLDSLSKLFLGLVSPAQDFTLEFNGLSAKFDKKTIDPNIMIALKEAFYPEVQPGSLVTSLDNMVVRQDKLFELYQKLQQMPTAVEEYVSVLLYLVETLLSFDTVTRDLVFGVDPSDPALVKDSALNLVKTLNEQKGLFSYLFQLYDGNMNSLLLEKPKKGLGKINATKLYRKVEGNLNSKKMVAERLRDISIDPAKYQTVKNAHYEHLLKIINGEVSLAESFESKQRDPQGYIEEIATLVEFIEKKNTAPELDGLRKVMDENEIKIESGNLKVPTIQRGEIVESIDEVNTPNIYNLMKELDKVGKALVIRIAELTSPNTPITEPKLQTELIAIQRYLSLLRALGFNEDKIMENNSMDERVFRMYLNGLKIDATNSEEKRLKGNLGNSLFSLQTSSNKYRM